MKHILFVVVLFFVSLTVVLADSDASNLTFVKRNEWGGYQPKHTPIKLETLPPTYVIISHTASGKCLTKDSCIKHVRNVQDMHVKQNGLNDIGYNFLVGGDGNVYVGRDWDIEGGHTKGYDKKSLGIAFIGDFSYTEPTDAQVRAVEKLLELAVKENKLAGDYKLLGQRQVSVTKSPGEKVQNIIKTWKHWTDTP